jgi:hypothetical protein
MVYKWLWDEEARDKYGVQLNNAVYNLKPCGHTPCDCGLSPYKNLPHFLHPAYMGQTTAREMTETMYKENDGYFYVKSPEKINDVLFHDIFHLGYNPLPTFHWLHVECTLDNYRTPCVRHKKSSKCQHTSAERLSIKQSDMIAGFSSLLAVPKKAGFCLTIALLQNNVRLAVLEQGLESFRQVYRVFHEASAKLEVIWTYYGSTKGEVTVNKNDYYDIPREAWVEQTHQKFIQVSHISMQLDYMLKMPATESGHHPITAQEVEQRTKC